MEDVDWADEAKVAAWLTQRFVEKDRMLDAFYQQPEAKGPLVENAREESSSWRDILIDLVLWLGVQAGLYYGLYRLGSWGRPYVAAALATAAERVSALAGK